MYRKYFDNFRENIERERTCLGIPQDKWAKNIGLSLSAYKRLISGSTSKISFRTMQMLHKTTGKMLFEFCCVSTKYIALVAKMKELSESQLNFVSDIIDFEARYRDHDHMSVIAPTGSMYDSMIYDSCNILKIRLPESTQKRFASRIDFGVQVTSNLLHPAYHQGDILLISSRPPHNGEIGIFVNNRLNRAFIRKFEQGTPCKLIPITDYGNVIEVDPYDVVDMSQWIKFGTVITKLRI